MDKISFPIHPASIFSEQRSGIRRRCCFRGCNTTDRDDIKMTLVKTKKKVHYNELIKNSNVRCSSIRRAMLCHYQRYYTLNRFGIKDERKNHWICALHELEDKVIKKTFKRGPRDIPITMTLRVPKPIGKKTKPTTQTKGNGTN